MTHIKRWTITRSFEMEEPVAKWMAYDLAGQAFEIVNCGARITCITLAPRQENIWVDSLMYEDDVRQAKRWGRLAQVKAGLQKATSDYTVGELKQIASDQEGLRLGALPAPALLNQWWPGVVKLAETLLLKGEIDDQEIYAIINPFIFGDERAA